MGPEFASKVNHTALKNAGAGYDIESVSVTASEEVTPRYIEVKAVSSGKPRFYWTSNEVSVAEALGSWYYLYLLPVGKKGAFSLEDLRIIQDPHSKVLGSASEWVTESDIVKCTLVGNPRSLNGK